ncbi:MAG: HAMP domain-containing histidine kinase [Oscillospiraceae bacterium]|nr:HAMP domain-containing histidine kinase [Oscillospiraceae bacterium]
MKKIIENEITRGLLIALLGVDMFITICLGSYLFERYNIGHIDVHPFVTGFLIVIGMSLFALIMRSAGHYKGREMIEPNFFDRVPLGIYLLADGGIILSFTVALSYAIRRIYGFELIFFLLAGIYLAAIFMCMSIAVRCKTKTLFTNTMIYIICRFLKNSVLKAKDSITYSISALPYIWQAADIIAAVFLWEMWYWMYRRWDSSVFIMCSVIKAVIGLLICARYAISYQEIRKGTEEIAAGNTDYKINTNKMPKSMAQQAEKLNSINIAVSTAVEKQLKSEKLKTELITNVSHDIKTPLTSIINYIDLLKKEELPSQAAVEYMEVLSRQSDKLKKLVEDLVEASKASTGNIPINLAEINLNLLINQTAGEYTDKAEKADLTLAITMPESDVCVLSDGRMLWRIFDNLLNNACKYSQSGTRIYINLETVDNIAQITFRNVSKTQLNISPDELMERFVRGDSSRNTEGSGLGLNIAQSLTQLLGGEMSLHIDGDLFKVVLTFPELKI